MSRRAKIRLEKNKTFLDWWGLTIDAPYQKAKKSMASFTFYLSKERLQELKNEINRVSQILGLK